MTERITAVLVYQNSETMVTLRGALERQGVRILHAESQAQAKHLLGGLNPAPLVFTHTELPDGTWKDVLTAAEKARQPVNVIVVARLANTKFYVKAIETGAFDFLVPPFHSTDLAYVLRSAMDNIILRRTAHLPPASPDEVGDFAETHEANL